MGGLITKHHRGESSSGSYAPGAAGGNAYAAATASNTTTATSNVALAPDGSLTVSVVDGILNLENKQVTNEVFTRISSMHAITRTVVSLSLANNRLTALVFEDAASSPAPSSDAANLSSALVPSATTTAAATNTAAAMQLSLDDEESFDAASMDADAFGGMHRAASLQRQSSFIVAPPPSTAPVPLRASASFPLLENLDLSSNMELFAYRGLDSIGATLKSLRLSNNALFKVPKEVWGLTNLTKLDLSHNRLLAVPAAVALLSQLHSLKLAHNSLATPSSSVVSNAMVTARQGLTLSAAAAVQLNTPLPEEMRFCVRLRRLDLSNNKLRELPVNLRVDREQQRKAAEKFLASAAAAAATAAAAAAKQKRDDDAQQQQPQPQQSQPSTQPPSAVRLSSLRSPASPSSLPSTSPTSSAAPGSLPPLRTGLRGGGAFGAAPAQSPTAAATATAATAAPTMPPRAPHPPSLIRTPSSTSSPSPLLCPPAPIRYFDSARISYLGITLLNLSNNQLDSLSPSIGMLRSLNSLNLGYNRLRSLPSEIALLSELRILDLRFNSLPSLLAEICTLPKLSKLCLQNNRIASLPFEIKRLSKLSHLLLSSNQLVDLPPSLANLDNLRVLKLCNNKLITIPDGVFRINKLRRLDLSFNKLTYLSPDVCNMPYLEDLRLWGNKLSSVPTQVLYADIKKLLAYLRATEGERVRIASALRYRASAGGKGVKGGAASRLGTARAYSVTRLDDRRFQPFGSVDDSDEVREPATAGIGLGRTSSGGSGTGGGGDVVSRIGAASAAPGIGRTGSASGGFARGAAADSGSDIDDVFNSDDEFTSVFRSAAASSAASRADSFTSLQPLQSPIGRGDTTVIGGSKSSSRRSTVASNRATASPAPTGSPKEHTTIVQPFSNAHTYPFPIANASALPSSAPTHAASTAARASPSSRRALRIHTSASIDSATRATADDDADDEADARFSDRRKRTSGSPADENVLTDVVKRERLSGNAQTSTADAQRFAANGVSIQPMQSTTAAANTSAGLEDLMQEWDTQSEVIQKQQSTGKPTGRTRVGPK